MGFRNIGHVAIGVSDMDQALAFYRDLLGLKVRFDETEEFEQMGELAPHKRRGVYLSWSEGPDEAFIVLDRHDRPGAPNPREFFDYGYHHFGFWVDHVDEIHQRAVAAGAHVVVPPSNNDSILFGEAAGKTLRSCILKDPDGNLVQFDQRLG